MPAFLKLGDIKGEATDQGHKEWINIESMSAAIHRTIPSGAQATQRARGETTLGDIVVVRNVDKSSVKIAESCAKGEFHKEAEIHFCTDIHNAREPYLKYKLKNVVISSYSFSGTGSGNPIPSEEVTFGYTDIEWTWVVINPETGKVEGNIPAKYSPQTGKAG